MAAGFKTATVNAADVPASQSDFPVYVDLSRLGITTLAEAQSVRVYADVGKSTQWAREIVSLTEMWVKIPTLTSTVSIFVDWDGVSSDYANTDTYGRNNVWTGYMAVYHMESNANDSTSNGRNGTSTSVTYASGGRIGGRGDFVPALNSGISVSTLDIPTTTNSKSFTMWVNVDTIKRQWFFAGGTDSVNNAFGLFINSTAPSDNLTFFGNGADIDYGTGQITTGTWTKITVTYDGSNVRYYKNGSLLNTTARALNTSNTSAGTLIGNRKTDETNSRYDGKMDEVRVQANFWNDNWETTEYNNQSDEPGFWPTWSDAAGITLAWLRA